MLRHPPRASYPQGNTGSTPRDAVIRSLPRPTGHYGRKSRMDTLELELRQVLPKTEINRRGFAVTALATGFALAVSPVGAQTITTGTENRSGQDTFVIPLIFQYVSSKN